MNVVFWIGGLLLLAAVSLHMSRLGVASTVPTRQKIAGSLWITTVLCGDALAVFLTVRDPQSERAAWVPLEAGLLIVSACTVVLVARFHRGWPRMLADTWLVAGVVVQLGWGITLAVAPVLIDPVLLIELNQVATALWLLALALTLLPGLGHLNRRLANTLIGFFVLRAAGMVSIFVASATDLAPVGLVRRAAADHRSPVDGRLAPAPAAGHPRPAEQRVGHPDAAALPGRGHLRWFDGRPAGHLPDRAAGLDLDAGRHQRGGAGGGPDDHRGQQQPAAGGVAGPRTVLPPSGPRFHRRHPHLLADRCGRLPEPGRDPHHGSGTGVRGR